MLLCATLIAAAITTAALAMADYWYKKVCRNPDNTWQICNFRRDGQCHSAPPPAAPIPGIPGS
jgi:hypothetical protein